MLAELLASFIINVLGEKMHIRPQPSLAGFETNYEKFTSAFPSEAERLNLARALAGPCDTSKVYPTQLQIGAHWGHNARSSAELAQFVYGLGIGMNQGIGQPVMVVTEGSLDDVLSKSDRLEGEFSATFGLVPPTLAEASLHHRFVGREIGKHKTPFLLTTMLLNAQSIFQVEGDEYSSGIDELEDQEKIRVYSAAIPLDSELYNSHLQATDYVVVYGLQYFLIVAEALQQKGFEPIEERLGFSLDDKRKVTDKRAAPPTPAIPLDRPKQIVEATD